MGLFDKLTGKFGKNTEQEMKAVEKMNNETAQKEMDASEEYGVGVVKGVEDSGQVALGNPVLKLTLDVIFIDGTQKVIDLHAAIAQAETPQVGDSVSLAKHPSVPDMYIYRGIKK